MITPTNKELIMLDDELQKIFQKRFVYIPDLKILCAEHIDPVENLAYKNQLISKNLKMKIPTDLIYKDPSSIFIIHPQFYDIFENSSTFFFSWNELYNYFFDICCSDKKHFNRLDSDTFQINQNSKISILFKLEYFNVNQIEDILKKFAHFAGKTKSLKNYCETLKFDPQLNKILSFIEIINTPSCWNKPAIQL